MMVRVLEHMMYKKRPRRSVHYSEEEKAGINFNVHQLLNGQIYRRWSLLGSPQ